MTLIRKTANVSDLGQHNHHQVKVNTRNRSQPARSGIGLCRFVQPLFPFFDGLVELLDLTQRAVYDMMADPGQFQGSQPGSPPLPE